MKVFCGAAFLFLFPISAFGVDYQAVVSKYQRNDISPAYLRTESTVSNLVNFSAVADVPVHVNEYRFAETGVLRMDAATAVGSSSAGTEQIGVDMGAFDRPMRSDGF